MVQAEQALAWARAERDNLLACLDNVTRTGHHARVTVLTAALAGLLRRDGPWTEAITRHATALQSARHLGNRSGEVEALNETGMLHRLSGEPAVAEPHHPHALELARAIGTVPDEAQARIQPGIRHDHR